jgi:hypothetical protein
VGEVILGDRCIFDSPVYSMGDDRLKNGEKKMFV